MTELTTDIRYLKGIGEKKAQAFAKLGVRSLYDLISFFPRRYEDRTTFKPIALTLDGETVCIKAMVADTPRLSRIRLGLDMVKLKAVDDSGSVDITFFNQSYVKDSIKRGETYSFFGKLEKSGSHRGMVNPVYEKEDACNITGRIVPLYRVCKGLNQRAIMQATAFALNSYSGQIPEALPQDIRERNSLCHIEYAYENIHFPVDFASLELARKRMIFEELFILSCALGQMRSNRTVENGVLIDVDGLAEFYSALPFEPTDAQKKAINEALHDMGSGGVMNRLVQGDVGSGKTLVAAALMYICAKNGYVSAFMAPTEILATQHYNTLKELLSPHSLRIGVLTGAITAAEKRAVKTALKSGEVDIIVGTHALFSRDVEYKNLALVVTDEQHRFGVAQRSALIGKGCKPHVMVMSATPIPRTLALMVYGDLDVSIIDQLPPGRQKVDTFAVNESYRKRLYAFMRKLINEGRQVFIVCPMVDENDEIPVKLKSAQEYATELTSVFPEFTVSCIHGRMKASEKDAVMQSLLSGETDILVATTVIEVGVDVPNAALIIIENAERFGLSQLHQLRGRVGRGIHKSYCVLVSDSEGEDVRARLSAMTKTNDGFKISEEDLRLRGPGDFFGSRQHGLPEMHVADLGADMAVMHRAQQEAHSLLADDPELCKPEHEVLRTRIEQMLSANADSFN